VTERVIETDDGVHLWTCSPGGGLGHGTPVVFSHGGPGLWDEGGDLVAAMVDDLATVVRWDQRGGGRSERAGPWTIDRFVADLDAVRAAYGFERFVVAGHSWGAGLSLRYALRHPDRVTGMVLLCGTDVGWSRHRARYRAERLARLGPHLVRWQELQARAERTPAEDRELVVLGSSTDFADRSAARELAERFGWWRFEIAYGVNAAINDETHAEDEDALADACRRLDSPALVVAGLEDPRPADGPRALASLLPAGRFVGLVDVGHVPWAEHPDRLREALRSFLSELRSR
jgi:proline iminopeptidase